VASVTDPADYAGILEEVQAGGGTLSLATRLKLMQKAFAHTADYDTAIAAFFAAQSVGDVETCYTIA
jgi:phosphoribosylaminoimidazolecarboxamide formyltransferase/IMP cyclohydrolase